MRMIITCALVTLLNVASASAAPPDDAYRLGPDSEPHEGVPQGKVVGPTALREQCLPGHHAQLLGVRPRTV